LASVLPFDSSSATGEEVIASGIENGIVHIPLHTIRLFSDIVSGPVVVGIRKVLPVSCVSLLLGNDLAGKQVLPLPKVVSEPVTMSENDFCNEEIPEAFPSCAVTRALAKQMAEKQNINVDSEDDLIDLSQTFIDSNENLSSDQTPDDSSLDSNKGSEKSEETISDVPVSRSKLILAQENDPEISSLFGFVLPEDELDKVPKGYLVKHGVLMRKWRPANVPATEDWSVVYQIVLPKSYRSEVLKLAHEVPMGGHLGINKTCDKIMRHFYWPRIRKEVSEFCKTCHTCQMVGKPNQKIPAAPLRPIPAFEEAFSRVL
jgi:His(2)-Cys(2) zinc finger.